MVLAETPTRAPMRTSFQFSMQRSMQHTRNYKTIEIINATQNLNVTDSGLRQMEDLTSRDETLQSLSKAWIKYTTFNLCPK